MKQNTTFLDCTLRDGGYYNAWDFDPKLTNDYLQSMNAANVDVVEIGFRFLNNNDFKGPFAFTTDSFLESLNIPNGMTIGVMVNGSDLCSDIGYQKAINRIFPLDANESRVDLIRIACHFHELSTAFNAAEILTSKGYRVGINLMQIADRSDSEIIEMSEMASSSTIEVLYFADSMGSMYPSDVTRIINLIRQNWDKDIGIHTHDNLGLGLSNSLSAIKAGASWVDATVTGMGRGPGNTRTEEFLIELDVIRSSKSNIVPLMNLIKNHFSQMKSTYKWGTNPYYYLAGKHGIHPTYIQEMLSDSRYSEEDIISVIEHLQKVGGKKFSTDNMEGAKNFLKGELKGDWSPKEIFQNNNVLVLGGGKGIKKHKLAIENFIKKNNPIVLALNTQSVINSKYVNYRIASHPVRLLADIEDHLNMKEPLITPLSMLPIELQKALEKKEILDYGLGFDHTKFVCEDKHCIVPSSLVIAYALAAAKSGEAKNIFMAGFDGYSAGDHRNSEIQRIIHKYNEALESSNLTAITPTNIKGLKSKSVYGF